MTDNIEHRLRLSRPHDVSSPEHRCRLEAELALQLQERESQPSILTARRYLILTAASMAFVGALIVGTAFQHGAGSGPSFLEMLQPVREHTKAPEWKLRMPRRYVASSAVLQRYCARQKELLESLPRISEVDREQVD